MAMESAPMLTDDHAQTALDLLAASDREFGAGDVVQGSENLWGAATCAMIAVAQRRGWDHDGHRALKEAAERLAAEHDDIKIELGFAIAEKFRSNFYNNTMPEFEMNGDRPKVRDLVRRALALL